MPSPLNSIRTILGLGGLVCLLAALPAAAIQQPDTDHDRYEVRLPMIDEQAVPQFAGLTASRNVEATLQQRYGDAWTVHAWNAHTGTPRWVYGGGASRSAGIGNVAELTRVARQVLAENADVLRADIDQLELNVTPRAGNKWAAHFQQTWEGYEVWQATVRMVFHENGNLMLMGSDVHPFIDLDPLPALSAGAAADFARQDLPFQPGLGDSYQVDPDLMVLPVRTTENTVQYHLVYRVSVQTAEPLADWITHVDAHTGDVVWRYNNIHFAFDGGTQSEIQKDTLCNGRDDYPVPYLNLNVSGAGSTTTDAAGNWTINGGGATGTVTASLQGPYVRVYNNGGANAQFSGTATAGVPFTLAWDNFNSRQDERDVFDAINRIHDFFQLFDADYGYVNQPINSYVNRTDGFCPGNAWWNGTINFCAAGGAYTNTGEIQQIVMHEFGHGIQDDLMGGWQGNEGLGEGNSDVVSILLTQDSVIGRGFVVGNCSSGFRDIDHNMQYPDDLIGQVHHDGMIIAGFHWDAMQLLQAAHGTDEGTLITARTWHEGRMLLRPSNQTAQVLATFTADDDNGNLNDGTPNHRYFAEAAENHSYNVPAITEGVFVYHDRVPYQTNLANGTEIRCTAASLGGGELDPTSLEVVYSVDGGADITLAMVADGGAFVASIPGQAEGSVVRYHITARNTLGDVGSNPRYAPDDRHYYQSGHSFSDEMEYDTAWIAGVEEDDATGGAWERGIPEGTTWAGRPVQLGADHTPDPGVACWVTGAAGGPASSNDVDGGQTTLLSPVFDLSGATAVEIQYWRYYTNNAGPWPDQDYWVVDITNDGGQTWSSVENTNQSDTTWQQVTIDVFDHFAQPDQVQLRFVASDEGGGSLVEAMVDDFTLVGVFDTILSADDTTPGLELSFDLAQNHPNPFNPQTKVSFTLERAGLASLQVFDTRGRLVRTLVHEGLAAGQHEVDWRGDDQLGRPVASGVYFYRLESGDQRASRRMLLVK